MRSGLLIALAMSVACSRRPPPSPRPTQPPPVLSREEVIARVEKRILSTIPGSKVTRSSLLALAVVFPEGTKAEFQLEVAQAICGQKPAACDDYVDQLMNAIRKDEDEDDDTEAE